METRSKTSTKASNCTWRDETWKKVRRGRANPTLAKIDVSVDVKISFSQFCSLICLCCCSKEDLECSKPASREARLHEGGCSKGRSAGDAVWAVRRWVPNFAAQNTSVWPNVGHDLLVKRLGLRGFKFEGLGFRF